MSKQAYLWGIIVVLFVSNIFVKLSLENNKEDALGEITAINSRYDSLTKQDKIGALELSMQISKQKTLLLTNNPELFKTLNQQQKIIVSFNEKVCTCSVIKCIMDFELNDSVFKDKVLMVGSFESDSLFSEYMSHVPSTYPQYNAGVIDLDFVLKDELVIYVADNKLVPSLMFFPEKEPAIREYYFNELLPNFFDESCVNIAL